VESKSKQYIIHDYLSVCKAVMYIFPHMLHRLKLRERNVTKVIVAVINSNLVNNIGPRVIY
jgi:hypothetical protein